MTSLETPVYGTQEEIVVNSHTTCFNCCLEDMFNKSELTDVTLVCGNRKFPAHKVILSASSSYFREMFRSTSQESKNGEVCVKEVDAESLQIILNLIYFRKVPKLKQTKKLKKLLAAAQMLQFECLYHYCCEQLMKKFSPTYFLDIWNIAEAYQNQKMLRAIPTHLAKHCEKVTNSADFVFLELTQVKRLLNCWINESECVDYIVEGLLHWVRHDSDRTQYLDELFSLADTNRISAAYLSFLLMNEALIKTSIDVLTKVMAAAASRMLEMSNDNRSSTSKLIDVNQQLRRSTSNIVDTKAELPCLTSKIADLSQQLRKSTPNIPDMGQNHQSSTSNMSETCQQILSSTADMNKEVRRSVSQMSHGRHSSTSTMSEEGYERPAIRSVEPKLFLIGDSKNSGETPLTTQPKANPKSGFSDEAVVHNSSVKDKQYQYYDMRKREWSSPMTFPSMLLKDENVLILNSGVLFVIVSYYREFSTADMEYNPNILTYLFKCQLLNSDAPIEGSMLLKPRSSVGAAVLNGQIYIVGGTNARGQNTRTVERYDISQKTCYLEPDMPRAVSAPHITSSSRFLYVVSLQTKFLILSYDLKVSRWSTLRTKTNPELALHYTSSNAGGLNSRLAVCRKDIYILRDNAIDKFSVTGQFVKSFEMKKSFVSVWGMDDEEEEFSYLYLLGSDMRLYRFHPIRNTVGTLPGPTNVENVHYGAVTI